MRECGDQTLPELFFDAKQVGALARVRGAMDALDGGKELGVMRAEVGEVVFVLRVTQKQARHFDALHCRSGAKPGRCGARVLRAVGATERAARRQGGSNWI